MRSRKSSTIIKKSTTLFQSKHPTETNAFSTNPSQVSQAPSNSSYPHQFETSLKAKFQVRGNLNKRSINPTSGFRRTFSRARNDDISNDQQKVETPLAAENKPAIVIQNRRIQLTAKQSFYQEKPTEIKQQPIRKTRIAFYQSTPKPNDKKYQAISNVNPEQNSLTKTKVSSSGHRQPILNTRRSKLQSQVKKKQVLEKEEKQKILVTPLKKSKNINVHTLKNPSVLKNVEMKVEVKDQEKKTFIEKVEGPIKEQSRIQEEKKGEKVQEKKKEDGLQQVNPPANHQFNQSLILSPERQVTSQITQQISRNPTHTQTRIQPPPNQPPQNVILQPPSQQPTSYNRNQTQSSISSFTQSQIQQLRRPPSNHRPQQSEPLPNNQPAENPRQNERMLNLSALIANTQDIIDFINRLNLRSRVQAFDMMVGQLTQLNMIAQQVQELGQIGNNLGYSLVNVFGTRIRQLQTTIINQVGQALIASFEQRIDPQFEALVVRQPSLRQGFSKTDIERTFEEKITFQQAECSICLESVKPGDTLIELQCFHQYHPICIRTWLENSRKCPMCRMEQKI